MRSSGDAGRASSCEICRNNPTALSNIKMWNEADPCRECDNVLQNRPGENNYPQHPKRRIIPVHIISFYVSVRNQTYPTPHAPLCLYEESVHFSFEWKYRSAQVHVCQFIDAYLKKVAGLPTINRDPYPDKSNLLLGQGLSLHDLEGHASRAHPLDQWHTHDCRRRQNASLLRLESFLVQS